MSLDEELSRIKNTGIRDLTEHFLAQVPAHFWSQPSSSTGKHHPEDERGKGGLALHTERVCKTAEIIMDSKAFSLTATEEDIVRAACLLHDTYRYGPFMTPTEFSLDDHPDLAHAKVLEFFPSQGSMSRTAVRIAGCVLTHTGRWRREKPETDPQWVVHLADNLAAKLHKIL